MKSILLQEDLAKALTVASRFASPKAQLPILGNVLFNAEKNKLHLLATNLETSVCISIGAQVKEEGKITVPSKVVSELVSNFPKGQLEIATAKEKMLFKTSGFSTNVLGMNDSDFPEVPTSGNKKSIEIQSKDFIDGIGSVLFSASTDEARPVLTGVLFIFKKGELTMVATDGFRLSLKKLKIDSIQEDFNLIIPKNALAEIARIASGTENFEFSFTKGNSQVIFGVGDTVLSSRVIQGEFPDYESIIPKKGLVTANVDKEDILRAVKVAGVFARDSANSLILDITDHIQISSKSASAGSQEARVDAKIEGLDTGKNIKIAFNYRFIEELLNCIEGQTVLMEFVNENKPGVFLDSENKDYLHLIMPVKL